MPGLHEVGMGEPGVRKGTAAPVQRVQKGGRGLARAEQGHTRAAERMCEVCTAPCVVQACQEHAPKPREASMRVCGATDLGHLPLGAVGLRDLEVDTLDAAGGAHDLDAAQVGPEVYSRMLSASSRKLRRRGS